jgi:hypothetical protein
VSDPRDSVGIELGRFDKAKVLETHIHHPSHHTGDVDEVLRVIEDDYDPVQRVGRFAHPSSAGMSTREEGDAEMG